jgi:hypothetical protein
MYTDLLFRIILPFEFFVIRTPKCKCLVTTVKFEVLLHRFQPYDARKKRCLCDARQRNKVSCWGGLQDWFKDYIGTHVLNTPLWCGLYLSSQPQR